MSYEAPSISMASNHTPIFTTERPAGICKCKDHTATCWSSYSIHKKIWETPTLIPEDAARIFPTPDSKFDPTKTTPRTFEVRREEKESPKIGRAKTWLLHRKHLDEITVVGGGPDHVVTLVTGEWSANVAYSHKSLMEICEKAKVVADMDGLERPVEARDILDSEVYCSMCSMTRE